VGHGERNGCVIWDIIFNYSKYEILSRKIYSTNGLERINAEIKRRIRKVGAFPNDRSALRLIVSIVMDVDEDWMTGRIYLHMQNTEN